MTFLTCSLGGPGRLFSNKSICRNLNPNEIFDQFPYMDISRDQDSFSPISRAGSILTLYDMGDDSESAFINTSALVGFNSPTVQL